jgi:hypothetical protein
MSEPVSDLHRAALEYAEAGLAVFPCRAGTKAPATPNGFKAATTNPAQITAWWSADPGYNIGWDPSRSGHAIIDTDGPEGEAAWAVLQIENATAPATLTIQTARGADHQHRVFAGVLPSTASKLGPKIDTRGSGTGYGLLPPSVIDARSGKPEDCWGSYRVLEDCTPAPLPEWVVTALQARQHEPAKAAPGLELDSRSARRRALHIVKDWEPAVEGKGGDARTLQVAMELHDQGVSEEVALALMEEHFNPRCEPPWEPDELAVKVNNAYRYAENEPGSKGVDDETPPEWLELARKEAERAPGITFKAPTLEPVQPVSFRDLLLRTVAPVDELIPDLIERGTVTFLAGPGAVHKSRTGLHWMLCIDSGATVYGRQPKPATGVYFSYEDHPDEVARRVQAISAKLGLEGGSGVYVDLSGRDAPLAVVNESGEVETQPFYDQALAILRGIDGHKFVVIDGTYNALRFVGSAKINEGAVMAGIALLQRLCLEADCTILALWHPSQAGQERGDASGWSVAWHNAPRARLSLSAVKDREDAFELKVEKRNHGPKGQPTTLYWCDGVLLPRTEVSTADQRSRFLDACVEVAEEAANSGQPIRKQARLNTWMLDHIEAACGYRPPEREVKEALAKALHEQRLRYVSHTRHRDAGYYPFDMDRAAELARLAKQHRTAGGTDE